MRGGPNWLGRADIGGVAHALVKQVVVARVALTAWRHCRCWKNFNERVVVARVVVARAITVSRRFWRRRIVTIFNHGNLGQPPIMAAAIKRRAKPNVHDAFHKRLPQQVRAKAQNIGVVVRAAQLRAEFILRHSGANSPDFVGGDAHADTSSTN